VVGALFTQTCLFIQKKIKTLETETDSVMCNSVNRTARALRPLNHSDIHQYHLGQRLPQPCNAKLI
jgi:hypothetical protein